MPKSKERLYRLEVTPDAYHIIEAESFLSGRTLKSIASEILSSHSSKEAKSLAASKLEGGKIQEPEEHRDEKPNDQMIIEPKSGAVAGADSIVGGDRNGTADSIGNRLTINTNNKPKRKRLEKDQAAIERIKEMWKAAPRPTKAVIAKEIGYAYSTVSEAIDRMRKRGELE